MPTHFHIPSFSLNDTLFSLTLETETVEYILMSYLSNEEIMITAQTKKSKIWWNFQEYHFTFDLFHLQFRSSFWSRVNWRRSDLFDKNGVIISNNDSFPSIKSYTTLRCQQNYERFSWKKRLERKMREKGTTTKEKKQQAIEIQQINQHIRDKVS